MTTLVPCKVCSKEISINANSCPHCGESIKKSSVIKTFIIMPICVIVALSIFLPLSCGERKKNESDADRITQPTKKQAKDSRQILETEIGANFRTDKFEIQISSVELRSSVGKTFFVSKPSEGAIYLAVVWNYKNIYSKPISSFDNPTLYLIAPDGTKYYSDIDASGSFATEQDNNAKILSDLNPGIKVQTSKVFEVSKELFSEESWKLLVDADGTKTYVLLQSEDYE